MTKSWTRVMLRSGRGRHCYFPSRLNSWRRGESKGKPRRKPRCSLYIFTQPLYSYSSTRYKHFPVSFGFHLVWWQFLWAHPSLVWHHLRGQVMTHIIVALLHHHDNVADVNVPVLFPSLVVLCLSLEHLLLPFLSKTAGLSFLHILGGPSTLTPHWKSYMKIPIVVFLCCRWRDAWVICEPGDGVGCWWSALFPQPQVVSSQYVHQHLASTRARQILNTSNIFSVCLLVVQVTSGDYTPFHSLWIECVPSQQVQIPN